MPEGARTVHQAIDNPGRKDDDMTTPQVWQKPKVSKQEAICSSCNCVREKAKGFWIGKKKNVFRCLSCNVIDNRIKRLSQNTGASQLWATLPNEEKHRFVQRSVSSRLLHSKMP